MGMKKAITVIAVIVILAGVGLLLLNKSSDDTANDSATSTSPTASSNQSDVSADKSSNGPTITYTDNGFSPASLTVKSGATITIKNSSSRSLEFESDPHPAHTDDPELNVGLVAPGESTTFTPDTTGTHGFHNHQNSSDTGTLIVQ